jgi:hypothetical protein
MSDIELSFLDCLLAPGAMLSLMTSPREEGEEQTQPVLKRLQDRITFARAQPLDIYLGTRHL